MNIDHPLRAVCPLWQGSLAYGTKIKEGEKSIWRINRKYTPCIKTAECVTKGTGNRTTIQEHNFTSCCPPDGTSILEMKSNQLRKNNIGHY
jgi:hypothetical protein